MRRIFTLIMLTAGVVSCGSSGATVGDLATNMGDADVTGADLAVPSMCVNSVSPTATQVTKSGDFLAVFDAVPAADGSAIYFTAIASDGTIGVYSVAPGASPASATPISTGGELVLPLGIAISSDGATLFVADPAARSSPTDATKDRGIVFTLPTAGGVTPTHLIDDVQPRGLTVINSNNADSLVFTGVDKTNGKPGVFSVAAAGGVATTIAEGPPFADPAGVAGAENGDLYVSDSVAAPTRDATILRITAGVASVFVGPITLGYPAGVALDCGDTTLFASTPTAANGYDTVSSTSMQPIPVASGRKSAAGLHRAKNAGVYAWVDSALDGTDAVFIIK